MKIRGHDVSPLCTVLILGAILRLAIAPFFADPFDFAFWTSTAFDVRTGSGIYLNYDFWYTPLWGYVISLMSPLIDLFNFVPSQELWIGMSNDDLSTGDGWVASIGTIVVLKIPLIAADVVNGLLINKIVRKITDDDKKALYASIMWVFNPLSIWISSGQGQFDTIALMFILLGILAYLDGSLAVCGLSVSAAVMTKAFPAFMVLPMLALILFRKEGRVDIKGASLYAVGGIAMTFLLILPQLLTGEMQFVTSFFTDRLFGTHPVPQGFDPTAMSFFSEYIYPRTDRSDYLLPSLAVMLIVTVFIAVKRMDAKNGIIMLMTSLCVFLIWIPAPGFPQYYVIPVGMLCLCSCIDIKFAYLALFSGTVGVIHLYTCFEYASPMVVMGLFDLDTLYEIHDALGSAFGIFDGVIKTLRTVPMILAVVLSFIICRRSYCEE